MPFTHHRWLKGYVLVLAATLIWSGNFIVARILSHAVPPVTLVVLRSAIAVVCLLPFLRRPLSEEIAIVRKHLAYLSLTAFMGMTLCNTLVYVAAATSNAMNLTLIAISAPVFTMILARLFLRDALTLPRMAGLLAATAGVIVLITSGEPSRLLHVTFSEGDLWMLGQAASFAMYSILVRKKHEELRPLTFLCTLFVLGMVVLLPSFAWELPGLPDLDWSLKTVGSIVYLGLGPSLAAYLCWNESVAIIGPTRAAFVYYCLPLFGGCEAMFLLGEPINAVHVVSGTLILGGVVFATRQ